MAKFKYVSARGDELLLTEAENFILVNIDSQTAVGTSISSVVTGGADGDNVNNVQANPRTIVLDLRIFSEVEQTKRKILDVVKIKQQGTLVWEQNDRTLEIKGVVESIEMPRWTDEVVMQITLHCSQPFWENIDYVISQISEAIDLHYFTNSPDDMLYFPSDGIPFGEYDTTRTKSFYNAGDVSVGLEIEIVALKSVLNPVLYAESGEFLGLGDLTRSLTLAAGDVVRINTKRNEKSVTLNGTSILNKVARGSTWLQLKPGENVFSIGNAGSDIDNMTFSIKYKQRYI